MPETLTHVTPREPVPNRWIYIHFYVRLKTPENQNIYEDSDGERYTQEDINRIVQRSDAVPLKREHPILINQAVLLGPQREVMVCDREKGPNDHNATLVDNLPLIKVTHVIPDTPEKGLLTPLDFYCQRDNDPILYYGRGNALSRLNPIDFNTIDALIKAGKITPLENPLNLPYTHSVYLNSNGEIYFNLESMPHASYQSVKAGKLKLEELIAKIPDPNIVISGAAHWSARGRLESKMWDWGIDINNKSKEPTLTNSVGVTFVKEIMPYLPDNYHLRLIPPESIPGDVWSFSIPIHKTKNPTKVREILQKYFPTAFKLE